MRVCIITHNVHKGDGQGRVNYELSQILLSRGIQVELLADRVDEDLLEAGATWTRIQPRSQRVNLVKVWTFAQMVDHELRRRQNHDQVLIACGFVLRHPHAINVAHFVHGTWLKSPFHSSRVRRGLNPIYQRVYTSLNARWELQAYAKAKIVVALSRMVRNELIEIGISQHKIEIVVNGVDLEEFKPGLVDRSVLGLPEGVPLGLFVGDLRSPIKNLDLVLRGLVSEPYLHLAVVGDLQGSVYPALAEQLDLGGRVHFLGFRHDVADIMRGVDFFVLPSRRDSCPLVLLEAMASGLPIITSTTVGTSNLVTKAMGVVVDGPEDLDSMRSSLKLMANDPNAVREMGKASRGAAAMYSWRRMGDRYVELLEAYGT